MQNSRNRECSVAYLFIAFSFMETALLLSIILKKRKLQSNYMPSVGLFHTRKPELQQELGNSLIETTITIAPSVTSARKCHPKSLKEVLKQGPPIRGPQTQTGPWPIENQAAQVTGKHMKLHLSKWIHSPPLPLLLVHGAERLRTAVLRMRLKNENLFKDKINILEIGGQISGKV